MALRFVPVSVIEEPEWIDPSDLAPLIASIREFGVLHPLLLLGEDGRYRVIAGRRRFRAAQAAGLTLLPCFVHHVAHAEADALARADNLRGGAAAPAAAESAPKAPSADLHKHLSRHLAGISSAQQLMVHDDGSVGRRAALDLIHVHAAHARWLVDAVDFIKVPARTAEERQTLGTLIDNLVAGFAAEGRLTGLPLRTRIDERAYPVWLDKQAFSIGMAGAILAVSPFIDLEREGALTITATRPVDVVVIEIGHAPTLMDGAAVRAFFDEAWTTRPGGWPAWLGAMALRSAVERRGGSVVCEADASEARIRLVFS